eukprot:TRINITY_DN22081_c0_g1_i2.p1 TRINITY_DN22081_c0_g1~~TRINITY_DN22081_c0_g1_i2.p1  ORF type:complete len:312 (+),score=-17.49 TRINITY_DN22081_c0_g1_i2:178-1113(+)
MERKKGFQPSVENYLLQISISTPTKQILKKHHPYHEHQTSNKIHCKKRKPTLFYYNIPRIQLSTKSFLKHCTNNLKQYVFHKNSIAVSQFANLQMNRYHKAQTFNFNYLKTAIKRTKTLLYSKQQIDKNRKEKLAKFREKLHFSTYLARSSKGGCIQIFSFWWKGKNLRRVAKIQHSSSILYRTDSAKIYIRKNQNPHIEKTKNFFRYLMQLMQEDILPLFQQNIQKEQVLQVNNKKNVKLHTPHVFYIKLNVAKPYSLQRKKFIQIQFLMKTNDLVNNFQTIKGSQKLNFLCDQNLYEMSTPCLRTCNSQ